MSARWISNTFSLNMIRGALDVEISAREVSTQEARSFARTARSAVGHPETARLFSQRLELEIAHQRLTITLEAEDQLLVGQYVGERLPEFQERRPEDAELRWVFISYRRSDPKRAATESTTERSP